MQPMPLQCRQGSYSAANAIYSAVDAYAVQPMPVQRSQRLYNVAIAPTAQLMPLQRSKRLYNAANAYTMSPCSYSAQLMPLQCS